MISRRIDLTENRVFGRINGHGIPTVHMRQFLDGVADSDEPFMSEDEYELLERHERLFGRLRHINEKSKVFNYEKRFEEMWRGKCVRCGARLVIWKGARGDLCHRCDVEMDSGKVPWKDYYGRRERSVNELLFDLR